MFPSKSPTGICLILLSISFRISCSRVFSLAVVLGCSLNDTSFEDPQKFFCISKALCFQPGCSCLRTAAELYHACAYKSVTITISNISYTTDPWQYPRNIASRKPHFRSNKECHHNFSSPLAVTVIFKFNHSQIKEVVNSLHRSLHTCTCGVALISSWFVISEVCMLFKIIGGEKEKL